MRKLFAAVLVSAGLAVAVANPASAGTVYLGNEYHPPPPGCCNVGDRFDLIMYWGVMGGEYPYTRCRNLGGYMLSNVNQTHRCYRIDF